MGHPSPNRRHRIPLDPRRDVWFSDWGQVVGGRIRRLRAARGMPLRQLCDTLLLPGGHRPSVGYLSQLERGWSSPPFFTYVAIAEALGETPARVLGPDATEVDPAETTLLACLRGAGIAPHEALLRLLGERHSDSHHAPVHHNRVAAVE